MHAWHLIKWQCMPMWEFRQVEQAQGDLHGMTYPLDPRINSCHAPHRGENVICLQWWFCSIVMNLPKMHSGWKHAYPAFPMIYSINYSASMLPCMLHAMWWDTMQDHKLGWFVIVQGTGLCMDTLIVHCKNKLVIATKIRIKCAKAHTISYG